MSRQHIIRLLAGVACAWLVLVALALLGYALLNYTHCNSIRRPAVCSDDGRFVAFEARSGTRIKGEPSRQGGVYLFDCQTASLKKVGVGGGYSGTRLGISNDGRYVDLMPDHPLSVYDCDTGESQLLSREQVAAMTDWARGGDTRSADGRFEVTVKAVPVTEEGWTRHVNRLVILDHTRNTMEVIGDGSDPVISADGSTVVFLARHRQVMLYHRPSRALTMVRKSSQPKRKIATVEKLYLTPDGRYTLVISANLTAIDTPFASDVYRYDRVTGTLMCVSSE